MELPITQQVETFNDYTTFIGANNKEVDFATPLISYSIRLLPGGFFFVAGINALI